MCLILSVRGWVDINIFKFLDRYLKNDIFANSSFVIDVRIIVDTLSENVFGYSFYVMDGRIVTLEWQFTYQLIAVKSMFKTIVAIF